MENCIQTDPNVEREFFLFFFSSHVANEYFILDHSGSTFVVKASN